jgi:hypothetical protein
MLQGDGCQDEGPPGRGFKIFKKAFYILKNEIWTTTRGLRLEE